MLESGLAYADLNTARWEIISCVIVDVEAGDRGLAAAYEGGLILVASRTKVNVQRAR